MIKKVASLIVDKRNWILGVMLLFSVLSVFLMQKVEINEDMTKYLPDDSSMKVGMDIMENDFPEMETTQTIRVMFDDLTDADKQRVLEKLETLEYVDCVDYEANGEDYNVDNHTLFVVNTTYDYGTTEELAIEEALDTQFTEYTMVWNNDDTSLPEIPLMVLLAALAVLLVVLFVMCGSWIEPVLFLVVIAFAILINMGTNIVLGTVSSITFSIASILQLVLSMDYSIILMNRYRQEKAICGDKKEAMKLALENSFSSISSSAMTTVLGLLMLVFMSFKIGMDLGIVLAKGVFVSMICVLTMMPGIILLFDKWIEKTAKKELHIPMNWAGTFAHKMRYVLGFGFLIVFIAVCFLQQKTDIAYTLAKTDEVAKVFPGDNMLVVVYDSGDEAAMAEIAEWLDEDEQVKSVMAYHTMLNKGYSAKELAQEISGMSEDMKLDESILAMFYYDYYMNGQTQDMTAGEFLAFVTDEVLENETFSESIDADMLENVDYMKKFASAEELTRPMSIAELAAFFDMEESQVEQLFMLYFGQQRMENGIRYAKFMNFLVSDVMSDPTYGAGFDETTKVQLTQTNALVQMAASGKSYNVSEMNAVLAGMGMNMGEQMVGLVYSYHYGASFTGVETMTLPAFLNTLVTQVAQDPNYAAYFDQNTMMQLQQLYGVVALGADTTKYHYSNMAAMMGMDEGQMAQLYMLYWGRDVADETVSVKGFIDFICEDILSNKTYAKQFDEETAEMLGTAQKLINAVVSEESYSAAQMAELLSGLSEEMDASMLELMYLYASGVNHSDENWIMTTEQLFNYMVDVVLVDERFEGLLEEDMKADLLAAKVELEDGKKQLVTDNYSRMIVTASYPEESVETTQFFDELSELCEEKLAGNYYFIGNSAMSYEMQQTFGEELVFITALTIAVIFLIVAVTFKSVIVPTILVSLVQCGVYITISVIGLQGDSIYYLALLIVECILMGATIDYAILFTNYYRENRKNKKQIEALKAAYTGSIHTIMTSGLILVLVTAIVGNFFEEPTISAIVQTVSTGSLCAILLIVFILPGMLDCFDRFITKKGERLTD